MDSKQKPEDPDMDRHKRPEKTPEEGRQPKYHVYVRLPFNRGDFVDPGTVSLALCSFQDHADPSIKGELG